MSRLFFSRIVVNNRSPCTFRFISNLFHLNNFVVNFGRKLRTSTKKKATEFAMTSTGEFYRQTHTHAISSTYSCIRRNSIYEKRTTTSCNEANDLDNVFFSSFFDNKVAHGTHHPLVYQHLCGHEMFERNDKSKIIFGFFSSLVDCCWFWRTGYIGGQQTTCHMLTCCTLCIGFGTYTQPDGKFTQNILFSSWFLRQR